MDKVGILCAKDSLILHDFSRRCMDRLGHRPFVSMPLPFLRTYLSANVAKEIDKDRLVIEYTADRFREGRPCGGSDVEALFELTKQVDKAFLRKVTVPSLSIAVRYPDIEAARKARIDLVARVVFDLLSNWKDGARIEEAVRTAYNGGEFRDAVAGVLHLYNVETKDLSRSIRLFGPLQMAVDVFAEALFRAMEEVASEMANAYTAAVFTGRYRA